jgi:hypothetical protein
MAKLIPSLGSVLSRMTSGERRVAQRLEWLLEDDYLCWYDVAVGPSSAHPDFLVLHPRRGLLVLEVKDWRLETIRRIDKTSAQILVNGRETRQANPMEQARQYAFVVNRLLETDPLLVQPPGAKYQGRLVFPWGYGVALTNITRKAFEKTDLAEVLPPHQVICQDEMTETTDPDSFQQHLWRMFHISFPCLLTLPQIDRIRYHLFPEVRVSQGTFELAAATAEASPVPDIIRIMDVQQERLARSLGEGHRVIHGVAGSGKTMILGYRMTQLASLVKKPVLVLCYNRALAARLTQMVRERKLSEKVDAFTFHGWCMRQLQLYNLPMPGGEPEEQWRRAVEAVIHAVEKGHIPRDQYGAVLIDEAHDFEPEWLNLIVQMVDQETNSLLVLYDDAQSINAPQKRRAFSFSQVGIQARGRTTILRLNYRNTSEVMAVACEFAREVLTPKEAEEDAIPLVAPETAGRSGPPPVLLQFPNEERELAHIVERAQELHKAGALWSDIAVLFRYNYQGERVAAALEKAGIPFEWFGRVRFAGKPQPSDDSVKLLTMHSSKGLEFPIVFIPCLDSMPNAKFDVASEAKLLYVAMTRAMDRLILTHRSRSPFVDRVKEALKHAA